MRKYFSTQVPKREPEYFYRVSESVTTFGADEGKHEPFCHDEEFRGYDLLKCRHEALQYYSQRLEGLNNGSYYLPFSSPADFQLGKHAAFSLTLSIVEHYNEDDEVEYALIGGDDKSTAESIELEVAVLLEKGLLKT